MWSLSQISIDIPDHDWPTVLIIVSTPVGQIRILAEVRQEVEDVLHLEKAHIDGLTANKLGRAGLNAIGRKLLEYANVREIIIKGATRTTGRCAGKSPRTIYFPHR